MTYLVIEIALFLLIAVVLGVLVGWWLGKRNKHVAPSYDSDIEVLEGKRRLDRCHREKVVLRRERKQYKEELEKLNKQKSMGDNDNLIATLDAANAQIQALMDDVQMRDDMITALEKNIKK